MAKIKLELIPGSTNYGAVPVRIAQVYPIPGADNIVRTVIEGNDVIIGKNDIVVGDKVLYFRSGTRLSEEYCKYNNLYDTPENNADATKRAGYISFRKRRVKAIKLKGIISDGMVMPISSLLLLPSLKNVSSISEIFDITTDFNTINDVLICDKYIIEPPTQSTSIKTISERNSNNKKLKGILVDNQFKFHFETSHFGKNIFKINPNDRLIITEKFHGSSVILSRVKTHRQLTFSERTLGKFFKMNILDTEYRGIWSSGKPKNNLPKGIENFWETTNKSYYKTDIWKRCWEDYSYAVEPGITIYGEVCNAQIQKGYDYSKYTHPNLTHPQYYVFVVYRITRTNDVGITDEFTWDKVEQYCQKYDLLTVPVLFVGTPLELMPHETNMDALLEFLQIKYLEKPQCNYCTNKVPNEGICIRRDSPNMDIWKLKSKLFIKRENDEIDAGITNVEDEQ